MRTTLDLSEPLLEEAKRRAAKDGKTLDRLVEEVLADAIGRPVRERRPFEVHAVPMGDPAIPLTSLGGLLQALDNLDSSTS